MTEAELERQNLRVDSEARDIIHNINKLKSFDENQKTRWVWELLQNAKDVATSDGVDIIFKLEDDRIEISHNGTPFETKHLVALLLKNSTKSLGCDDGTTGKYGTGFVTTHILNKEVTISGIHKNASGERHFKIEINRTSALLDEVSALNEMKKSIAKSFETINILSKCPAETINKYSHSFIYNLNESSKVYAELGLFELEKNILFTLLINKGDKERKKINSVTIIKDGATKLYTIESNPSKINGLNYLTVGENDKGILYKEVGDLIFGIPVKKSNEIYSLLRIENQAVLYKEFPLIGTEFFNLPVFIQHSEFKPTEPRDGIITIKDEEDKPDSIADSNRSCLLDFRVEYLKFLEILIQHKVQDLYHLALSGLPIETKKYTGKDWYIKMIQKPIRDFIVNKEIINTVAGKLSKIGETKFPTTNQTPNDSFYNVVIGLLPDKIPSSDCFSFLDRVINQEIENWPENISISLEQLLSSLPEIVNNKNEIPFKSLKILYQYLQSINSTLGETFCIYLNEKNEFQVRDKVKIYPHIDNEIKSVSERLGRNLDLEFLNRSLGNDIPGIGLFDLEDFYKKLNNEVISKIDPEKATEEQISAILHINTLFKTDRATKREVWLDMLKELLPTHFGEKKYISIDYDNYFQPAELWTVKYICYLIQKEIKINQFADVYFNGNIILTYDWLNRFLNYINDSREDIKAFLTRYNIIPTQNDGIFKAYSEYLYKEDNPDYFDEELKIIAKEKCIFNSGDYLIKNEIQVSDLRTTNIELITKHIDKLFEDERIATKVAIDGALHNTFNIINTWFDKHSDASSYLKTFASKRDMLYVISLGEGFSKQIKTLKEYGKSMEDIAELAKISLSASEMRELERVANELGTNELLKKAQEMISLRDQRLRWKQIGNTAENAFKKIFEGLEMEIELSNPDVGKDFEILLKSNKFSIEIKNVIEGKENVRLSILQGRTAVKEKENYALCVFTRLNDTDEITEEYFKKNSKFIKDIGYQIGDKIENWDNGLKKLFSSDEIKVYLDEKKETVYVNRSIWRKGDSFDKFMIDLQKYFNYEIT
ncbi:sacsin N-terminal ATP-binding-like domain-containing protein [Flavobacterium hercynium]|uniref:Protein NO VEIN C-terminal domain-containing protein n=1 Tax=Flavobacterium hercynium TaxID=387094 RepID=A0A226GU29_9FLAO|nr:hypothetical protein [Flavobacterium hercynium]OXA84956.1 hypothetical protein B0A66_20055 [Flavobacterium hercynium]SMP35029.1 hypothetical protein SAMN06265346_11928 [Flavobacterium hercynium]